MKRQTPTRWRTWKLFFGDWVKFLGYPKKVRVDSEGAWMSPETNKVLKSLGIVLDPISEEAHWQLGMAEVSIKLVRTTLDTEEMRWTINEIVSAVSGALSRLVNLNS